MARDPKRFTIRVGKRPARSTSVRSQRAGQRPLPPKAHACSGALQEPWSAPPGTSSFPMSALVPPPPPPPPAKPKGLFKRIAARFRANSNPGAPPPPPRDDARTAALRARGLLPPADLSAQEAVRDAALAAAVPAPEAADDGAPSAAQLISAGWRRRASLCPDDSGVALDADEPALLLPPGRRLSTSASAPSLVSPTSGTFPSASLSPVAEDTSSSPTTPTRRRAAPSPSHPTFVFPLSPWRIPLPPSPPPSIHSLDAEDVLLSPVDDGPSTPARRPPPIVLTPSKPACAVPTSPRRIPLPPSPALPSAPFLAPEAVTRARSDTGTTLPSLASTSGSADDAPGPPTPLSTEPAPLPSVLEDSDDDVVAPLPRSPTIKSSPAPAPVARSKSTLRMLGRKLTARRPPPPVKSTTLPPQGLARAPSTRLATTALHDRGTISAQTSAIANDEERRLAEMAFLDF